MSNIMFQINASDVNPIFIMDGVSIRKAEFYRQIIFIEPKDINSHVVQQYQFLGIFLIFTKRLSSKNSFYKINSKKNSFSSQRYNAEQRILKKFRSPYSL